MKYAMKKVRKNELSGATATDAPLSFLNILSPERSFI